MDIVYCFDENYALPTLVSATSVVVSLASPCNAQLHMVHQGLKPQTLEWVRRALPSNTQFYDAVSAGCTWATSQYSSHLKHVSSATNLRLCLPEILPESLGRVLYLDSDILVLADLGSYVGAMRAAESGVGARSSGTMQAKMWGRGLFPQKADVLSAAVLVLDLPALRRLDFCGAARKLLSQLGPANDQTVFNLWCRGCFTKLPVELNMTVEEAARRGGTGEARVLHYEGAAKGKPWTAGYLGPLGEQWRTFQVEAERRATSISGPATVSPLPRSLFQQEERVIILQEASDAGASAGRLAGFEAAERRLLAAEKKELCFGGSGPDAAADVKKAGEELEDDCGVDVGDSKEGARDVDQDRDGDTTDGACVQEADVDEEITPDDDVIENVHDDDDDDVIEKVYGDEASVVSEEQANEQCSDHFPSLSV